MSVGGLSLERRRILVVGASSGIGRAVAVAASNAGATIAVMARRKDRLQELAESMGERAHPVPCDVTDEESCGPAVEGAVEWLGGLDHVVYAAGTAPLGEVSELSARQWHTVLGTNTVGAALVMAAALPSLRKSEHAVATLLSSSSVVRPWPSLVAYAASKAALEALARGIQNEEPSVRVVCLRVGPTLTPFADAWEPERAAAAFDRWMAEGYLRHRVLESHEVADAVLRALVEPPPVCGPQEVTVVGEPPGLQG